MPRSRLQLPGLPRRLEAATEDGKEGSQQTAATARQKDLCELLVTWDTSVQEDTGTWARR